MECSKIIQSEEYADFIGRYSADRNSAEQEYTGRCPQFINDRYVCLYEKIENLTEINVSNYVYSSIPKLYGLMDTNGVAATGAIRLQNQARLELTGKGVIVGFIDTGINYEHNVFKTATGQTRILGIWDQTDNRGNLPDGLNYGSEYTMEDINRALTSETPRQIVPQLDENGHGTFLAGVACGRYDEQNDFIGAAPDSYLAMVKLKPAKKYLKDYFLVRDDAIAYQENDIMLGVTYLRNLQLKYNMPLVIVIGLGCGNGSRTGLSPLSQVLDDIGNIIGNCVVVCSGNEGNERLHYQGNLSSYIDNFGNYVQRSNNQNINNTIQQIYYEDGTFNNRTSAGASDEIEIRVGDNNGGFVIELWGRTPDIFSVGFVSPLGENTERIDVRKNNSQLINFLLDNSTIEITYNIVESSSGNQLIFMRFINPSPGIWLIRVFGTNILNGRFDIWGGLRQFVREDVYFLKPEPDTTLTTPAGTENTITVGGYNSSANSLLPSTGRGFTIDNRIKPELVAPSVNIWGPGLNNDYVRKTGTSVGTALVAGCCAQFLQWGIVENNEPYMKTNYVKSYLIRGTTRDRDIQYPDKSWGFGTIDVFESFRILTR